MLHVLTRRSLLLCLVLALTAGFAGHPVAGAQAGSGQSAPSSQSVPQDLRPLLAAPQSEMRLVVRRYTADRATLGGNYAGGGRGGGRGGRGGGGNAVPAAQAEPVPVSPARVARLKRFDQSWTTALAALDTLKFSAAARTDLAALQSTIKTNQAQLDADARTLALTESVAPFAPALVALIEARMKLQDIDSQAAAGVLTRVTREIAARQAALETGLSGAGSGAIRVGREQAATGARAVEIIRGNLSGWFNFYNTYDPVFTWWMGMPYQQIDAALQKYVAFLNDRVAPGSPETPPAPVTPMNIPPAPAPKYSEVPDLREIIALPQDEMTPIVQMFFGQGGGRGGRGAAPRDLAYCRDWLTALKTLDFDKLTRNAQVDYLVIRRTAETQLAREGMTLPDNPPRKADNSGIPGPARGRLGLIQDLQDAWIPYTPEQLIALAEKEFAWCDAEMLKATREMGFGTDWKKAMEKVKTMHPPPGGQPAAIRDLVFEAIDYLRANNLVTVPQVAAESQHMAMMSPERQLVNPFFTGGAQITVSYPTNTMEYDARMQSMRGNNTPFSHATAHHEMIPGHNLTGYIDQRFNGYRAPLPGGGPFFGEGWALYWELVLYDKGFNDTPEERIGALFWRMHRCARIIFSLRFHMGQWSPQEAIDFLVDRVGHERDNATAEVRRSFDPSAGYSALYQAAYLLGGLQLKGLRRELVESGQMTEKAFHDEILRQGSLPIAVHRLNLTKQRLTRDMSLDWKFYGDLPSK
jgi:uncharacterized protein (DUF885 family)